MTQSDQNLENLFNQARASEPRFDDSAFTDAVMQKVAANASVTQTTNLHQAQTLKATPRFNVYDALGLGIGLAACFTMVDAGSLISAVGSIMPDKLVLSPMTLIATSLGMGIVAWGGWLALEGEFKV